MSGIQDNGSYDMAHEGAVDFQQDFAYGAATKRCNCKKARCLKLYCVCFSAGVYCSGCACRECFNTIENQDIVHAERSKKLAASPGAFAPKVELKAEGEACHKKGCRCRRSRCVKKYCECFDAQVYCSASCRCESCLNMPKGDSPTLGAIPHVPGPALARGAAADYIGRLPAGAGISGPAATVAIAAAAFHGTALAAANGGATDMDIDTGLGALDALSAGLAAGREGVPGPAGALATHGSVPFAASGAGSFLLSLQAGSLGLPGLSFLENPDGAIGLLGREFGSGEAQGPRAPGEDGAAATGGTIKPALADGGGGSLHADGQAEVKAILSSVVVRRPPTSAFMFAEAEAILAAEEQPPVQTAGAAAATAATAVVQAPPSTTDGAGALASAHLSAAAPGCAAAAPGSRQVKQESGDALLEGAGSIRVASASAGAAQETAAAVARAAPAADAPSIGVTGSEAAGKPEEGKALPESIAPLQTRNSSDPEMAPMTLARAGDDGTGPQQVPDSLPLMPAGPAPAEPPAALACGATAAADGADAANRDLAAADHAPAVPLQQPGDAAAPDATVKDATMRSTADPSVDEPAAGDTGGRVGSGEANEPRGPSQQGPRGGNSAAAAADELSPMEAVLAAPTLLFEEPHRAEELAGALGLDLPQQLAARKAAHILRTLLCMAASAVRLTRSGAVGCSRWERSQGRDGAPSLAKPLASHHSLCAPSAGVTCGLKPGGGTAATSTLRAPPPGEAHDGQQRQRQSEQEQEGTQAQQRQQQPHPLGLPPLSGAPSQPFQGAAAIPAAVAYRGAAGSSGQEGGGAGRWHDGGRHSRPAGRVLHLPPLQLPPLSFSCGSQGGAGGTAAAAAGGCSAAMGAPGTVRLGHGSYLFSAAGRLTGPEASAASGSQGDGGEAQLPAALGEAVATTIMSAMSPGPGARQRGRELARRPSDGPEASFSQAVRPPPHPRGHGRGSDALAGQRMLRRGSRVKRPNSLLADMQLDDGLDDLDDRANIRVERRSHHDALPHGYIRRHHHHHHHHYHHGALYPPRYRSVSPTGEPPSPKRSRPSGPGGWRSAGRGRAPPAAGRRSRAGSWRGGADDEADEEEESYGGEESEAGPVGATRPGAMSHSGADAVDFPLPRAGGRRRDPSRASGAGAWAMAAAIAAGATHVSDRDEAAERVGDAGEVDEEECQEEDVEAEEREEGARREEAREMSEEDSGNGASEMEAMQALFDLRSAVAVAATPVAAAM